VLLDWRRTKAYMAHVGMYGFVYLNLKGREPQGIVPPEDFESVREALIARFLAERLPGRDEPLFKQVLKGEQVFARKQELNLPDLVLVPADGFFPRCKLNRGRAVRLIPRAVGGTHRPEGIYALEGPGIAPTPGLGPRAGLADIAPTLLAVLGQPIPQSMTGIPMLKLFEPPPPVSVAQASSLPFPGAPPAAAGQAVYSEAEEKEIEKRLADLGYLE
jgi:predicted AlkP superfamily phosphohydrolase/phosphomutase